MNQACGGREHTAYSRKQALGLTLMAIAMLTIPGADALGKYLSKDYNPLYLGWARYFAGSIIIIPFAFIVLQKNGVRIFSRQLPSQLLRTILLVVSVDLYYMSISEIPLADALGGYFIAPVLASALSAAFLRETMNSRRIIALCMGFAGALFVAQPSVTMSFGTIYAVGSSICMALYLVTTRFVSQASDPIISVLIQYYFGASLLVWPAIPCWSNPDIKGISLIFLMGLISVASNLATIFAFRMAETTILAPLVYLELIGSIFIGWLVFGDFPGIVTWIGLFLIAAAGLTLIDRQRTDE